MKKIFIHIGLFVLLVSLAACNKPQPTELFSDDPQEQSNLEITTISPENEFIYSSGYDSTALSSLNSKFSSVISVSSVKTTYKARTVRISLASAVFFDKAQPVKGPGGKMFSYRTKSPGVVSFENVPARMMPFIGTFRDMGMRKDTLLGFYYLLYKYDNQGDPFIFQHDSHIDFKLKTMTRTEHFEIPTPAEILGEVDLTGSLQKKNLEFTLRWNGIKQEKVEVIVGGTNGSGTAVTPFFSLHAQDNGKTRIPASLLKNLPLDQFGRIVFTLIRKKVTQYDSNSTLKDNSIVAQSVHSIQVDIPK
ncbi:MAG: hypothetical protein ACM3S2_03800 [Ignavibacteriales bacterium]